MVKIAKWKVYTILAICLAGIIYALPNAFSEKELESYPSWLPNQAINLGLDLQGGSHLLLQVEVDVVLVEHLQNLSDTLRRAMRTDKITFNNYNPSDSRIRFKINPQDQDAVKEVINRELGTDVVTDFTDHETEDDILKFPQSTFADFTSVMAAASQAGSDVVITADAQNSVTLNNVTLGQLDVHDFEFIA